MITESTRNKIAFIVADENEINHIKDFDWVLVNTKKIKNYEVLFYKKEDQEIIFLHSGIGIVNAAAGAQFLIDNFEISAIYNYGAVGAYSKEINIYDVILPQKFYFYDVETPWYKFGQTPGEKEYYENAFKENISKYNLASGNSFLFREEDILEIQKNINVSLFDMETAAYAQVCFKNNVPFFVAKGISDIIGASSVEKEDINIRISLSSKKALEKLLEFI